MPHRKSTGSDKNVTAKTVNLTEKDVKDAARLLRLLAANGLPDLIPAGRKSPNVAPDREALISRARILFNSRRLRERHFNRSIFGEPAWEILLILYIAEHSEGRLTTSRLADWIKTPLTTVLRWLDYLAREGLIERQPHPTDRRTVFISLLDKARIAMDAYLGAVAGPE